MICDADTCAGCRYLVDERDDGASLAEFLANCQHAKCKVVRLVRQQISKLQNTQYERHLNTNDARENGEAHEEAYSETPDKVQEAHHGEFYEVHNEIDVPMYDDLYEAQDKAQQARDETQEARAVVARRIVGEKDTTENAVAPWRHTASPGRGAADRKWMLRVLSHVRHRARLILAAAAVGVIVWTALVYGVLLGATACGSGRTCHASSLKYTHAKRSLF